MNFNNAEWRHWAPGQPWPQNVITAGEYREGGANSKMFIARRQHGRSILIGYAYENGTFYAGLHGSEVSYPDFELLCTSKSFQFNFYFIFLKLLFLLEPGFNSQWIRYSKGLNWPTGAKVAGEYNEHGTHVKSFIAKRHHEASTVVGYAYENGTFYFGWHGAELSYDDYYIFVEI